MNHEAANIVLAELKSDRETLQKYIDNRRKELLSYDGEIESIQVTIGFNDKADFSSQTGDNSYTGPVHCMPHWLVTEVYADTTVDSFLEALETQLNNIG